MLDLCQHNLKISNSRISTLTYIINYFVHNTAARILLSEVYMHAACKT